MRRLAAFALLLFSFTVFAQDKLLTLDDIYDPDKRVNFSGRLIFQMTWIDGSHYLERRGTQLMKVEAATGKAEPFYDAAKMEAAFAKIEGVSAAEAKRIATSPTSIRAKFHAALVNFRNDLYFYNFGSDSAIRLTKTSDAEENEDLSPNGKKVAFVRNFNLFVVDVATQQETALTTDGNAKLFNGKLDWVYQEEIYGRGDFKSYWWSPDSSRLAYLQLDEAPVKEFTVLDHIPNQQDVELYNYPKAGTPNPNVKLGVVGISGGATKWVDIAKYSNEQPIIARVGWKPDSARVVYHITNREQTWLDVNLADPNSGQTTNLFREQTPAWVEADNTELPRWLQDGTFLFLSERNGWKHIYRYSNDGKLSSQITLGKWEARTLHGVDEKNGWVYFSGTERSHIGSDAYRIKLDGSGLQRLTQAAGTHNASFDPTFNHFIDAWSDVTTPPQAHLYKCDGSTVRAIDENKVDALKQYKLSKPEFLQVKNRDGFLMEAMMIKPPDFDPNKKYPVWSFTYSGPHSQSVVNRWGGANFMWHQMLAQKGYIIWICDNRSASGKGIESTWTAYKNLGVGELRDLEDGVAYLKSLPFVDGSRIGLNGWSYGGFMTSYALTHSTAFKIGIAGGSVTDWNLYDTIYTERYMLTPQNNSEGYAKTSVIKAAKNLSGKLLLIHGTMDDNVHMQNTIQLVYELQKAGKQFELMVYPKSRHGVVDPYLVKHLRELMTRFILENL
jgi:dipeptidyl-peptidase-4